MVKLPIHHLFQLVARRFLPSLLLLFFISPLFTDMGWAETPSASDTAMLAMKGPDSPYSEWTNLSVNELMNKGSRYLHDGRYDYALLCYTIVVERPENDISSSERKLQVKAYTDLANLYVYVFYDFEKAMGYIESAQKLAIETHQENALPLIYTARASIMLLTNFFHDPERVNTQAFDIYKKAYSAAKKQDNWLSVIVDVINLSSNALSSKKLSVAMPVVEDYLSLNIPDTFPSQRATRQMCLGIKAVSEKQYDKAINLFKSALTLCDEKTYKNYPLMVYSNIQYTYEITNRYEEALREARKIADILSKGNSTDALCMTYYDISRYERKLGNISAADSAYLNYLQLKDQFLNSSKLLDAEQQRFIRDLQTAHNQVELLSMKKKNLTLLSFSLTAILLLIILFLVISYRSYRRLKIKNKELYQSNLALLKADEQRRLITSQQQTEPEQPTKYSSSTITEDEKQQLATRILRVMDNVDEICSDNFTINRLAQLTGSNRNYCSQVMNEVLHKSFSVMLAECRIKEACRRFNNTGQQYTIEAVAQSVGYKSRSSFVTAFKRFTGLPPSEYQRLAQKK